MDKAEFLNKIKEIGTCEDEATRRTLLTEMSDDVSAVFDRAENLATENQSYIDANERLREANMKLFLQVGEDRNPTEPTPETEEPEPQKRKFEDLFNEKGEIKL